MVRHDPKRLFPLLISAVLLHGIACSGSSGIVPVVASTTPTTGTIGTIVTIAGSRFQQSGDASAPTNPTVTFTPSNGGASVVASVTSFSATSLDVAVPAVATSMAAPGTAFDVTVANPGGGSATLKQAFTMAAPVINDVNGGLAGSGTPNSVFIVDGQNFGDLTAPAAGYSVDFRDAATGAVVASASVAFASSDWQDIFVVGTVPGTLTPSTTYQLTVTTPSGTSAPATFLVLGNVSFSPSTIAWTATSSLPTAQQGFPAVIANVGTTSYLYALGGNVGTPSGGTQARAQNVATAWYASLDAQTGALGAWTATSPLPAARGFAAAVTANAFNSLVPGNGNVYVLGGLDASGTASDTVYYASLASDGSIPAAPALGAWTTTTPLPQPLFGASAVIFHGRIYVAGGNDSTGAPVAKVYGSRIRGDGSLDPWETLPDLPVGLAYHQLVTSAGYLYVLGGDTASADPVTNVASASAQSTVYAAQINIRSGAFVNPTWSTNATSMSKAREKFSAVVAGGYILVSGGLYSGQPGSSEQSYAAIGSDGSIGSFNGATGTHTISNSSGYDFFDHAAACFVDANGTPHVLVLGGQDVASGTLEAGVWYQH